MSLLQLSIELKFEIISKIHRTRDLRNLALVCKDLLPLTQRLLYRDVRLKVPYVEDAAKDVADHYRIRSALLDHEGVQWIKGIALRPSAKRRGVEKKPLDSSTNLWHDTCDLLDRIPHGQVTSFVWMLQPSLRVDIQEALLKYHSESLQELQVFDLESAWRNMSRHPNRLLTVHCHSIQDGLTIGNIVYHSRSTITSLLLGDAVNILEKKREITSFLNIFPPELAQSAVLRDFSRIVKLRDIRNLQELAIIGLNIYPFTQDALQGTQPCFNKLKRLTIDSCVGDADFLLEMANLFERLGEVNPVQLKEFVFQAWSDSLKLEQGLTAFLRSFNGLEKMCILVADATSSISVQELICDHGETLKTLVLEYRDHPTRDPWVPNDEGRYDQLWKENIPDIVKMCPNLRSLGAACPIEDFHALSELKFLKTLHLREPPEVLKHPDNYDGQLEFEAEFKDAVAKTFQANVYHPDRVPTLENIVIGRINYIDKYDFVDEFAYSNWPYNRLIGHTVEWEYQKEGHWEPLILEADNAFWQKIREEGGVFDAPWKWSRDREGL